MSTHFELSNGGWVEFKDKDSVTNRDRKRLIAAYDEASEKTRGIQMMDVGDATVLILVQAWSLGEVNAEALDNLPTYIYDEIVEESVKLRKLIFPQFTVDDAVDSASPTPASAE